jgi:hypothetical protein
LASFGPGTKRSDASEKGFHMESIKVVEQHSFMGTLWFGGWLFTIGFLQLTFWKAVFAIVLWPYYVGVTFSSLVR